MSGLFGTADSAIAPLSREILGTRVDVTDYTDSSARILGWAAARESRYVCVACVNNVMQARGDDTYRRTMNEADLVVPDGAPIAWGLRRLGVPDASQVRGTNLSAALLAGAADAGVAVGFYGGSPETLDRLVAWSRREWPRLDIRYAFSPPFRDLTQAEQDAVTSEINASGTQILLVGLGCPKQEMWMADQRGRIDAVMVGTGAAFDFLAGVKKQAPRSLQRVGLEWLFRLATEPRRLWRRYLGQNPRFALLFAGQLLGSRRDTGRIGGLS